MSWPGFFTPAAAWLFVLIAPLVVLYFLKLKRPRQEVSSLVLWRQVINDNRVNSPFQRFKKNILLLLQLLLLALLILAGMQPFLKGDLGAADRLPILIDHSASMASLDKPGGVARLAQAKQRVVQIIDGLGPDQQVCLVAFSANARKLCDFTNNRRVLHDALDSIQVEDVAGNLDAALRLTSALAQAESFDRAMLFSDGNFPSQINAALAYQLDFQQLDAGGANFGVTRFNARRAGENQWDVFALIEGSFVEPGSAGAVVGATVELFQDGVSQGKETLLLAQAQAQQLVFSVNAPKHTALELKLTVDGFDSLRSDNTAYLDLSEARKLRIYCPPSLSFYRRALGVIKDVEMYPSPGADEPTEGGFDLVVSDQEADLDREASVRLFVNLTPPSVTELLTITSNAPSRITVWRRESELFRSVNLADRELMDEVAWRDGVLEQDFAQHGFDVLMFGNRGPLMLAQREQARISYFLLFDTDRSTLPYYGAAFPVMIKNLTSIALSQAGLASTQGWRTGVFKPLPAKPDVEYTVRAPEGKTRTITSTPDGRLTGVSAPHVGRYRLTPDEPLAYVGAALLDSAESSLAPVKEILLNDQAVVTAEKSIDRTDYSYWRQMVIAALGVLALEWWFFNRKVGGFFGL